MDEHNHNHSIELQNLIASHEDIVESNPVIKAKNRNKWWFLGLCVCVAIFLMGSIIQSFEMYHEEPNKELVYGEDGGIILFGDSLIGRTCDLHDLIGRIQKILVPSSLDLGYVNLGVGADTIQRIRNRLPNVLTIINNHKYFSTTPTIVIIVWDTDICDYDENDWPPEDIPKIRAIYQNNLRYVIQQIVNTGAKVSVGGPMLCKESYKNSELDIYVDLNKAVCNEFVGVDYMNLRHAFLQAEAQGLDILTTDDGEHPSSVGAQIMAQFFSVEILKYLGK